MCSREGYFDVYFPSCAAMREINNNITLKWAHKQFVMTVNALFNFSHDITNPLMALKMVNFTHHPLVSLARFTFCWWHHNRLLMMSQWPDNCDASTRKVISNSLDITFIHHGFTASRASKDYCKFQHIKNRTRYLGSFMHFQLIKWLNITKSHHL